MLDYESVVKYCDLYIHRDILYMHKFNKSAHTKIYSSFRSTQLFQTICLRTNAYYSKYKHYKLILEIPWSLPCMFVMEGFYNDVY